MQTKRKSNSVITHQVVGRLIEWTVYGAGGADANGKPTDAKLMLDMSDLSEAVSRRAAIHGMIQRVSDAAAIGKFDKDGVQTTPQAKLERMSRLVEHYASGTEEWGLAGTGGGQGEGLLLQVLKVLRPGDGDEKLRAFVSKLKPNERTKLLNSDKLRPIADSIRAEQAKGIDADKMLSALDDEPEAENCQTCGGAGTDAPGCEECGRVAGEDAT